MARKRNGDRRREHDLAERRKRVFEAWSNGEAQTAIAERENVHPGQIVRDLDHVLGELQKQDLDQAQGHLLDMLTWCAWAEGELRSAWERSKRTRERIKIRTKRGAPKSKSKAPGVVKGQETEKLTEERDGNPKIMSEMRAVRELKARLLGLLRNETPAGSTSITVVAGVDIGAVIGSKPGIPHDRIGTGLN